MREESVHSPPARESGALAPGAVLAGKYRVDRVLGSGGMAAVYEATHLQLGEPVAIKMLHSHVLGRHGALERFLREARVAMRLRSEHVARVFDVGTHAGNTPFIVMELLRGSDLATLLLERGPLPVATAVDYLLQACQALVESHSLGVVHRDLKPANLFLCTTFDGLPCVKVLDFGVSKLHGGFQGLNAFEVTASSSPESDRRPLATRTTAAGPPKGAVGEGPDAFPGSVTLTQAFLGSPQYMAPEQIRSARDVDARADVWAVGVILFELLSGTTPFKADSLNALCESILERHPRPLRVAGGVPAEVETAIMTCLARDPADRYQSVRAFAESVVQFGSDDARLSLDRIVRMEGAKGLAGVRPPAAPSGPPTLISRDIAGGAPLVAVVPAATAARRGISRLGGIALLAATSLGAAAIAFFRAPHGLNPAPEGTATSAESRPAVPAPLPLASTSATPPEASSTPMEVVPASLKDPKERPGDEVASPVRRPRPLPRAGAASATPSSSASARTAPDPALKLDTGELFMERR